MFFPVVPVQKCLLTQHFISATIFLLKLTVCIKVSSIKTDFKCCTSQPGGLAAPLLVCRCVIDRCEPGRSLQSTLLGRQANHDPPARLTRSVQWIWKVGENIPTSVPQCVTVSSHSMSGILCFKPLSWRQTDMCQKEFSSESCASLASMGIQTVQEVRSF